MDRSPFRTLMTEKLPQRSPLAATVRGLVHSPLHSEELELNPAQVKLRGGLLTCQLFGGCANICSRGTFRLRPEPTRGTQAWEHIRSAKDCQGFAKASGTRPYPT
jgi:hypothetical protein